MDTSARAEQGTQTDWGGWAQSRADAEDSSPKRSSWARAWRMREAPMRELMEAESDVA